MASHINIPKKSNPDTFIAGAPDASAKVEDENQKQISLKLPLDLLADIDAAAKALNLSRASFIKMHMTRAVKEKNNV